MRIEEKPNNTNDYMIFSGFEETKNCDPAIGNI